MATNRIHALTLFSGSFVALLVVSTAAMAAPQRPQPADGQMTVNATVALRSFETLVEQQLADVSLDVRLLARTAEAQSGDFTTMLPLLRTIQTSGLPAAAVWFAAPDGSFSTVAKGPAGSLADRPYFARLMAGESVPATLVISRSTGRRSIVVAEPVRRGGQIVGAVGVSLAVEELSRWVDRSMALPANVVFYALDASGQTALHRDPSLMFQYPSDLGDPTLRAAVQQMMSQPEGRVVYTFRGKQKTVFFRRSATLGWVFALGFEQPL